MQGFWLVGLFCQKATKIIGPYFQYFSSSSSELTFTKSAIYCKHKFCNTINQGINIHIVPSLKDVMTSWLSNLR
jgi:hypothetical protein